MNIKKVIIGGASVLALTALTSAGVVVHTMRSATATDPAIKVARVAALHRGSSQCGHDSNWRHPSNGCNRKIIMTGNRHNAVSAYQVPDAAACGTAFRNKKLTAQPITAPGPGYGAIQSAIHEPASLAGVPENGNPHDVGTRIILNTDGSGDYQRCILERVRDYYGEQTGWRVRFLGDTDDEYDIAYQEGWTPVPTDSMCNTSQPDSTCGEFVRFHEHNGVRQ